MCSYAGQHICLVLGLILSCVLKKNYALCPDITSQNMWSAKFRRVSEAIKSDSILLWSWLWGQILAWHRITERSLNLPLFCANFLLDKVNPIRVFCLSRSENSYKKQWPCLSFSKCGYSIYKHILSDIRNPDRCSNLQQKRKTRKKRHF